jgi:hypothetical protein
MYGYLGAVKFVFNSSSNKIFIEPTFKAPIKLIAKKPFDHSPNKFTLSLFFNTSWCF